MLITLLLITLIQTDDDLHDPTRVYNAIISLKEEYSQGRSWTNDDQYVWEREIAIGLGYGKYTGRGCMAFAMIASDAAFGNIPAYNFTDMSKIRVGDILRINNNTHSVIVLKVIGATSFTIAEGNYNSAINWERDIDLTETGFNYGFTRSPTNPISTTPIPSTNPISEETVSTTPISSTNPISEETVSTTPISSTNPKTEDTESNHSNIPYIRKLFGGLILTLFTY